MIVMAIVHFLVHLLYALYHGMLGIMNSSLWFITMCGYYTILSTMRFCVVLCSCKHTYSISEDRTYFVMKLCGALFVVLSFVLIGVVYISMSDRIATKYDTIVMITIATYTFYKLTMVLLRAVKQKKIPLPYLL